MIVAFTEDPLVLRNLARRLAASGETLVSAQSLELFPPPDESPRAVVVDLDGKDALSTAARVKSRWKNALVAGFLSYPNRQLWQAAESGGVDLVATRGALAAQLEEKLKDWQGTSRSRLRVCDVADLAGRLGVIARLDDLPMGPVAIYHIGGEVFALQDVCPHAGARLSEGDLAGATITCPRHGSQFDVRNGERLRGPAENPIPTYRIEVEGGQVFLVLE